MFIGRPDQEKQPLRTWLPKVLLTFLVFLILAFVVYKITAAPDDGDLGERSMWALIVAMGLLVLLPVVDRIQEISLSPSGFSAKLAQTKAEALAEVSQMENREAAEMVQGQIIQARTQSEVKAAQAVALELNVNRVLETVKQAIAQKRKLYVRYKPDPEAPVEAYLVAPFDVKPGKTAATRANDYLWVHSYEHGSILSLRLGRVLGAELSQETFDPAELMAGWKAKQPEWNVAREW